MQSSPTTHPLPDRPLPDRPLRVLFLATYFPKPGNPLLGTWALAQAQAIARQGAEVRVVSCNPYVPRWVGHWKKGARAYSECPRRFCWGELETFYPHWLVYPAGSRVGRSYSHPEASLQLGWLSARRELEKHVRAMRPDVIFAHHTMANGYLAERLHRKFGVPYVITDHLFSEISDCAAMPARRATFERIANSAALMVGVASRMENDLKRLFPRARTTSVPNGADPPPPEAWTTPRPPELEGKTVVLSAGVFYPSKGFPALVRAWARVAPQFPDAVLRLVGDGRDRPNVESAIEQCGVQNSVQLVGAQPHAHVAQEMVWADAFALISKSEPFGVVFTEAMAAQTPLIWPSDAGVNDVLENEVHGLQVPPHDEEAAARALERMLSDAAARARWGKAARTLSEERLTWDANARVMCQLFEKAVSESVAVSKIQ